MFGFAVICYLFLGGLCGGLCAVSGVSGLSAPARQLSKGPLPEQRRIMTAAFVVCAGGLVFSALLLLADAGNVSALKYLFLSAQPSYLAAGAWAVLAGIILSAANAVLWYAPTPVWGPGLARILLSLEVVVGLFVVLYTGLFLASMPAVPLWNTWWLVALFAASSASGALALFAALASVCGLSSAFAGWIGRLVCADVAFVLAEAVCAVGFVFAAAYSDGGAIAAEAARTSVERLMEGDLSAVWWGGFAFAGVVLPLLLGLAQLRRGSSPLPSYSLRALVPVLCACVGGLAMRYSIVSAGMHPALGF